MRRLRRRRRAGGIRDRRRREATMHPKLQTQP